LKAYSNHRIIPRGVGGTGRGCCWGRGTGTEDPAEGREGENEGEESGEAEDAGRGRAAVGGGGIGGGGRAGDGAWSVSGEKEKKHQIKGGR
jgi:hypothetical protein